MIPIVALVAVIGLALLFVRAQRRADALRRKLAHSEELRRSVVETALEAIITIDQDGVVRSVNGAAEQIFGYRSDEIVGRNVSLLMPVPYRNEHDSYIRRYHQTGEARIIGRGREVIAMRKDGSVFPVALAVSHAEGAAVFTGVVRDISERVEAQERLRQADRLSAIGTLAAGLGHDMSNVLLPLRARMDVMEQAELDVSTREQLVEIRKSARYLQDLADGLHLLALDPADADASRSSTDVSDWWQQTKALLGRSLPKHVELRAEVNPGLPIIQVAPHRLTQAVLNLFVNAGKAVGDEGKVELDAEFDPVSGEVRIVVRDDGCGMTPDVKRRALEPFFTTKTRGLGTGLGLSLVHGVVTGAGGSITIDSAPNEGTAITLGFPVTDAARALMAPAAAIDPGAPLLATVRLENARIRALVVRLLAAGGFVAQGDDELATALYVTDCTPNSRAATRALVAEGQRVLLIGDDDGDPEGCGGPGVTVVRDPSDLAAVRAAIAEAAAALRGPSSDA